MKTPSLTGFVVALILVGMFAGIFSLFIVDVGTNYSSDTSDMNLTKYNKLSEINTKVETSKSDILNISQPEGVLDIIGGFFYNGYSALTTTITSFEIYDDMVNEGFKDANLGASGILIKNALTAIIIILIIFGIVLAVILKVNL